MLFVVPVFSAFFLYETMRRLRIHPQQYLLVGMAMFFMLINALSEHVPFELA